MFSETKTEFTVSIKGQNVDTKEILETMKSMNFGEDSSLIKNKDMSVKLTLTESGSVIELSKIPDKLLIGNIKYAVVNWLRVDRFVWLNAITKKFHFEDETNNIVEESAYDTLNEAYEAGRKYGESL